MMKLRILILIFALFLIFLPIVYSAINVDVATQANGGTALCNFAHGSYPCTNANDNNVGTTWDSGVDNTITELNISLNHNYTIKNFSVQVSLTDTNDLFAVSCYDHTLDKLVVKHTFEGAQPNNRIVYLNNTDDCVTDKIRFNQTTGTTNMQVDEFRAFNGTPTPVVDETPPALKSSDSAGCTSCVPYQSLLQQPWKTSDGTETVNATANESLTNAMILNNATNPGNYNASDMGNKYGGTACTGSGADWTCTPSSGNELSIGENQWVCVAFNDTSGNQVSNASFCASMNITDGIPPAVNPIVPENNSHYMIGINNTNIQFSFNFTDNYFSSIPCNVSINDINVYYNTSTPNGTNITYFHSSLSIGTNQYWNVTCVDNHSNQNSTRRYFNVALQASATLLLNGLSQDRTYEFRTKVNITANCSSTTGLACDVCVNLTAPYTGGNVSCGINWTSYLYNITTLRQNQFSNGSFASSNGLNVSMDNRTELIRTYLNVTSPGTITNLNISYYGQHKNYTGDLIGKYVKQTEFIHLGVYKDAVNLTYLTGGSNYIYIDIPANPINLTFEISGFDLDADNKFSYDEHFNTSAKINHTLSYQTDVPLGIFDEFIANNSRWDLTDVIGTPATMIYYSTQGGMLYAEVHAPSQGDNYQSSLVYSDEAGDFRNSSLISIDYRYGFAYSYCTGATGSRGGIVNIYVTDGDSNVLLKSYVGLSSGAGGGSADEIYNMTLSKNSEDYKSWKVYINGSLDSTKDFGDLDFTKQIELKFRIDAIGVGCDSGSGGGTGYIFLRQIDWSGVWLNRSTNNGTYKSSGNFTSKILNVTKTNISRALLSWTQYEPSGTKIKGYVSNNCLNPTPTFEEVQSDLIHVFTTQTVDSNKLCVRFELNSSVNITSPVVRKYEVDIIPSAITNITVDLEDDEVIDWSWLDTLNSSNSPKVVNFTGIPIGDDITIKISAQTAGQIQIDNFKLNNSLNPIRLNHTYFEDCYNCTIDFEFSGDPIAVSGLEFDFYGSWNYTATAWYSSYLDEHKIQVYYSKFNISYPEGYEWYDISAAQNASNVTPYGQTDSTPIWNVTKLAYDKDINIYIKTNETIDNCLNITLSNNTNRGSNVVNETFSWQNNTPIQLNNKNILNETVVVFNQSEIIHNPVFNESFTWFNGTAVKLNYGNLSDKPIVVFNQTEVFQYKRVNESFIWWNTTKVQLYIQRNLINGTAVVFNQTDGGTEIGSDNYTVDYALGTILLLSRRQNLTQINESVTILLSLDNSTLLEFEEIIQNNSITTAVNASLIIINESLTWAQNNSAMELNYGNLTVDSEILYNNGTKINRGTNYTMNYTNGSITFINASTYWNGTTAELVTNKFNITYTYTAYSILLNREIDYKINYTTGNFTLINASFNNSELFVTYNYTTRLPFENGKQFGINYSYTVYNGTPIADSNHYLINYTEGTITLITNYTNNTQYGINYSYLSKNSSIIVGVNNYSINPTDGTINLTSGYGDREIFGINYTYLTYGYDYDTDFTFKLNTSYQQIIADISTSKGIWSWENYYSCGWGLNWSWFYFASVCDGCYYDEPQLDFYNIIVE